MRGRISWPSQSQQPQSQSLQVPNNSNCTRSSSSSSSSVFRGYNNHNSNNNIGPRQSSSSNSSSSSCHCRRMQRLAFRMGGLLLVLGLAFCYSIAVVLIFARVSPPNFSSSSLYSSPLLSSPLMIKNSSAADPYTAHYSDVHADATISQQQPKIVRSLPEDSPDPHDDPPNPSQQQQQQYILKAFLEAPHPQEEWLRTDAPLPDRSTHNAQQHLLVERTFPHVRSCRQLPAQWPVNQHNEQGGAPSYDDPFLPWIHDVFPTWDASAVQFVAQNLRRCQGGDAHWLNHTQAQAALFQHVSVRRVNMVQSRRTSRSVRYQLVPHAYADPDGMVTRFICRFQPSGIETLSTFNIDYDWIGFRKRYRSSYTPDHANNMHIHTSQLLFQCPIPEGLRAAILRTSTSTSHPNIDDDYARVFVDLIPIRTPPRDGPSNRYFPPWYAEHRIQNTTGQPFDPIRAWGHPDQTQFLLPRIEDSGRWQNIPICAPSLLQYYNHYNNSNAISTSSITTTTTNSNNEATPQQQQQLQHRLVACIWASSGYATRGDRFAIHDGQRRLLEWILHHKNIGFEHFYLYDNSAATATANHTPSQQQDQPTLQGIANLFPHEVTYIPWPSKVCNNRPNNVKSPGERSSQYAAEASCRLRFGPHVEWIGQFDIDEYLIPMGEHTSALTLLDKLDDEDIRIVSFGSRRAWPRKQFLETPLATTMNEPRQCGSITRELQQQSMNSTQLLLLQRCFDVRVSMNASLLRAYNCDQQSPNEPKNLEIHKPAEKQLYRPGYVTHHFVHYSAATTLSALNRTEWGKHAGGVPWTRRPFPDPRQRFANERTEGLMIHSKAVAHKDTTGWEIRCTTRVLDLPPKHRGLCQLGTPWPAASAASTPQLVAAAAAAVANATSDGWLYNCYVNQKVEELYVPQLEAELQAYRQMAL